VIYHLRTEFGRGLIRIYHIYVILSEARVFLFVVPYIRCITIARNVSVCMSHVSPREEQVLKVLFMFVFLSQ